MGIDAERVKPVSIMQRQRLLRVILWTALLAGIGLLYGFFVSRTGIAIPCIFHLVTGLKCPGCGVTRMCVALMHLDFRSAYEYNQMIFLLSPVLLFIYLTCVIGYIRNGHWETNRTQNVVLYVCIALLIGFGIARNIVG